MTAKPVHTYLGKILLAVDDLAATLIWRNYGISISAMAGLAMRVSNPPKWARCLSWMLDKIEPNHCELAIQDDLWRNEQARAILAGNASSPPQQAGSTNSATGVSGSA